MRNLIYAVRNIILDLRSLTCRTVRSAKAEAVKQAYAVYGDKFEVAVVDDIATSDLTQAFKGLST